MLRHTLNIDQNLEPCHKTCSITERVVTISENVGLRWASMVFDITSEDGY